MKSHRLPGAAVCGLCLCLCLTFGIASFAVAEGGGVQLSVEPRSIAIAAGYDGTRVVATGAIPDGSEAILRFVGASCDLHLKERGKVFGIMWMNLDSLTFRGVPSVCLVSSATDFDRIAAMTDSGSGTVKSLRLAGIGQSARIEAGDADRDGLLDEFLKLKKHEGLYRESVGDITYGPVKDGMKTFRAEIPIPSRLTPGSYMVELAAIGKNGIVAEAHQGIDVQLTGFPALLSKLAFDHAALYGILATLIALVSGLAIGMVFQAKGAH